MADLIDLSIIQSYPPSCLNRGEDGTPKTCVYGGENRGRVSSQCLKRTTREYLKTLDKTHFQGIRTKNLVDRLQTAMVGQGIAVDKAEKMSKAVTEAFCSLEKDGETKAVMFISPAEIETIVKAVVEADQRQELDTIFDIDKDNKYSVKKKGHFSKIIKNADIQDDADIAMSGRMMAGDKSMTTEAAYRFAHSITVHKCKNSIDYFSALNEDNLQGGAGHIDEQFFNSGTYFRAIEIDVGLLGANLERLSVADRRTILAEGIEGCLIPTPAAKRTSMLAATRPYYVLAVLRNNSSPLSLAGAFESPIRSFNGYDQEAVKALEAHWKNLKILEGERIGDIVCEISLCANNPTMSFTDLGKKVASYVW